MISINCARKPLINESFKGKRMVFYYWYFHSYYSLTWKDSKRRWSSEAELHSLERPRNMFSLRSSWDCSFPIIPGATLSLGLFVGSCGPLCIISLWLESIVCKCLWIPQTKKCYFSVRDYNLGLVPVIRYSLFNMKKSLVTGRKQEQQDWVA